MPYKSQVAWTCLLFGYPVHMSKKEVTFSEGRFLCSQLEQFKSFQIALIGSWQKKTLLFGHANRLILGYKLI